MVTKRTDLKFDDDVGEEERKFYIKLFPNIDLVKDKKVHCTSCNVHLGTAPDNENNTFMHPLLKVAQCKKCFEFYNSGEFTRGEDGSELYCRWCGQGGEVYCCAKCPYVFCKACISLNLAKTLVADIRANENWNCFICSPKITWPIRATYWALMNFISKQKKLIQESGFSDADKKRLMKKDLSTCCGKQKNPDDSNDSNANDISLVKKLQVLSNAKKRKQEEQEKNNVVGEPKPKLQIVEKPYPQIASVGGGIQPLPTANASSFHGITINKLPVQNRMPVQSVSTNFQIVTKSNPPISNGTPVVRQTYPPAPQIQKPYRISNIHHVPTSQSSVKIVQFQNQTPPNNINPTPQSQQLQVRPQIQMTTQASTPPPLVIRNRNVQIRPQLNVVNSSTNLISQNRTTTTTVQLGVRQTNEHAPVYHNIGGFCIDLNSAAQHDSIRLPNGKLIQVKKSTTNNANQNVNNLRQQIPSGILTPIQTQPQHQFTITQTSGPVPNIQLSNAPQAIFQPASSPQPPPQIQPMIHHQPPAPSMQTIQTTPLGPVQIINGNLVQAMPSQALPQQQQKSLLIRNIFPNTQVGKARTQLQNQIFNAMEICQHLSNKLQTLTHSNPYKNANSLADVKELYIHLSYLFTYGIGRLKTMQEKVAEDMASMGFKTNVSDLMSGVNQTNSDNNASDVDEDEIEIVEPKTTTINLDSDNEDNEDIKSPNIKQALLTASNSLTLEQSQISTSKPVPFSHVPGLQQKSNSDLHSQFESNAIPQQKTTSPINTLNQNRLLLPSVSQNSSTSYSTGQALQVSSTNSINQLQQCFKENKGVQPTHTSRLSSQVQSIQPNSLATAIQSAQSNQSRAIFQPVRPIHQPPHQIRPVHSLQPPPKIRPSLIAPLLTTKSPIITMGGPQKLGHSASEELFSPLTLLAGMLEVDLSEGGEIKKKPVQRKTTKKTTQKLLPHSIKQQNLKYKDKLLELKQNDKKLKQKCAISLTCLDKNSPEILSALKRYKFSKQNESKKNTESDSENQKLSTSVTKLDIQSNLINQSDDCNDNEFKSKTGETKSVNPLVTEINKKLNYLTEKTSDTKKNKNAEVVSSEQNVNNESISPKIDLETKHIHEEKAQIIDYINVIKSDEKSVGGNENDEIPNENESRNSENDRINNLNKKNCDIIERNEVKNLPKDLIEIYEDVPTSEAKNKTTLISFEDKVIKDNENAGSIENDLTEKTEEDLNSKVKIIEKKHTNKNDEKESKNDTKNVIQKNSGNSKEKILIGESNGKEDLTDVKQLNQEISEKNGAMKEIDEINKTNIFKKKQIEVDETQMDTEDKETEINSHNKPIPKENKTTKDNEKTELCITNDPTQKIKCVISNVTKTPNENMVENICVITENETIDVSETNENTNNSNLSKISITSNEEKKTTAGILEKDSIDSENKIDISKFHEDLSDINDKCGKRYNDVTVIKQKENIENHKDNESNTENNRKFDETQLANNSSRANKTETDSKDRDNSNVNNGIGEESFTLDNKKKSKIKTKLLLTGENKKCFDDFQNQSEKKSLEIVESAQGISTETTEQLDEKGKLDKNAKNTEFIEESHSLNDENCELNKDAVALDNIKIESLENSNEVLKTIQNDETAVAIKETGGNNSKIEQICEKLESTGVEKRKQDIAIETTNRENNPKNISNQSNFANEEQMEIGTNEILNDECACEETNKGELLVNGSNENDLHELIEVAE